jgi:hypothetical protein
MNTTTRSTVRVLVTVAALMTLAGTAAVAAHPGATDQAGVAPGESLPGEADVAPGEAAWGDAGGDLLNVTETETPAVSSDNVTLSLTPSNPIIPPGEQQSYDVVATGVEGGVAAYELNLTVADPEVGAFVEYSSANDPLFDDISIGGEGAVLEAMVSLGDNKHDPSESVVLGTVTVEPGNVSTGSTAVNIDAAAVMDNENFFYGVASVENATLAVNANAVSIEPEPEATEQFVGSPFPVEVAVGSPKNGISAFDIQLELDGNGSIVDYELPRSGSDDTEIVDGGSLISLDAAFDEPYDPADEQVVATVTVVGEEPGEVSVASTGANVTGIDGNPYVSGFGSASATLVEGPPPLPGLDGRPTDVDSDLRAEDVDGDLVFDIFDVQALFSGLESEQVQSNPSAFNFNDDPDPDKVAIFDVQALFKQLG